MKPLITAKHQEEKHSLLQYTGLMFLYVLPEYLPEFNKFSFFTVIITISYSEEENQWVVENLVKPTGIIGEAWLGLAELQSDNRFRWTDSSPIPYVNWDDNQPATNKGSMECVSMRMGKT